MKTCGAEKVTGLLTAAQMRATETAAIDAGHVTGLALMEQAGQGVVAAILAQWPAWKAATDGDDLGPSGQALGAAPLGGQPPNPRDISVQKKGAVLCGPGNNGGDGFVIARLLAARGWDMRVWLYGDAAALPPDARTNYERWREIGPVAALAADWGASEALAGVDLVVDALFGTGLTRPVDVPLAALRDVAGARIVAVDLPSGLCSDSGRVIGRAGQVVQADLTVSFHARKLGHVLAQGPGACGRVVVADIGLAQSDAPDVVQAVGEISVSKRQGHKFSHGHALVLSGGTGKGGAARLAARAALRIGAGVVTLGCPPEALLENAVALDAVMLRQVPDAAALGEDLRDPRLTALAVGPGFGMGPREGEMLRVALAANRPMVLDADALSLLARGSAARDALHGNCVLTPHMGEFARLFPDLADQLSAVADKGPAVSKVDVVRAAAARVGCVVLLKGADTVIAEPSGACWVHSAAGDRQVPWLATAGAGDVLAGFIAGLLARGFAPAQAAGAAVWLHVSCALAFGPGLIAEDLPDALPRVLAAQAQE